VSASALAPLNMCDGEGVVDSPADLDGLEPGGQREVRGLALVSLCSSADALLEPFGLAAFGRGDDDGTHPYSLAPDVVASVTETTEERHPWLRALKEPELVVPLPPRA
jgi:hypothetical protein